MPATWYPIAPTLTAEGLFAALAHLEGSEDYQAVPESAAQGTRFGIGDVIEGSEQVSVLATLGVVGAGNMKTAYSSLAIYRDAMVWHEAIRKPTDTGKIRGTRWGAGFRLTLTVTDFRAEVSADMKSIAGATELGIANTSYELKAYGLTDPSLFNSLPVSGRFDRLALKALGKAEQRIRAYMDANRRKLRAVPFQVLMIEELPVATPLDEARAFMFTVKLLGGGGSLEQALARGRALKFHVPTIRRTYVRFFPDAAPRTKPPQTVITQAKQWLRKAGV